MARDETVFAAADLARMAIPAGDDGVVVGADERGRPAVLATHHPVPYEVLLLGGLWTAWALALRAVASGVRVMVETGRPAAWSRVLRAADQEAGWIGHCAPGAVPPLVATVGSPVLVVRDLADRASGGGGATTAAPWQPVLTVVPNAGAATSRMVRQAALVGVQRLSAADSGKVGRLLGLTTSETDALLDAPEDATLWCAGRYRRWVRMAPTDAESGLLGPPRRADPPA